MALLTRNVTLGIAQAHLIFISLIVGWGTYMGIGRSSDDWEGRGGVFDFLVGMSQKVRGLPLLL